MAVAVWAVRAGSGACPARRPRAICPRTWACPHPRPGLEARRAEADQDWASVDVRGDNQQELRPPTTLNIHDGQLGGG